MGWDCETLPISQAHRIHSDGQCRPSGYSLCPSNVWCLLASPWKWTAGNLIWIVEDLWTALQFLEHLICGYLLEVCYKTTGNPRVSNFEFLILNVRGDLLPKNVFGMNFISCLDSGAAGFGLPAFGSPWLFSGCGHCRNCRWGHRWAHHGLRTRVWVEGPKRVLGCEMCKCSLRSMSCVSSLKCGTEPFWSNSSL